MMAGMAPVGAARAARRPALAARVAAVAAISLALLALLARFGRYLIYLADAIQYPYGLDYGEGIVWQQALLIPGPRMYGDITRYPYIVFHYPPLYHLVTRLTALATSDMLQAGRVVSAVSALGSGAAMGIVIVLMTVGFRPAWTRWTGALVGGLTFFSFVYVQSWSALMRVDMLAIGLGYAGLVLAMMSQRRPALLYVAMLAFVAAVYTKQTAVAAPLASLSVLLVAAPRRTLPALAVGAILGFCALGVLEMATDGRFLSHVVSYNVNRFSLYGAALRTVLELGMHPYCVLLACGGLFALFRIHHGARADASITASDATIIRQRAWILFLYAVLVTAMLAASGKAGAGDNYFIEWFSVGSIMIGLFVCWALRLAWRGTADEPETPAGAMVCVFAGALLIVHLWRPTEPWAAMADADGQRALAALTRRIAAASAPVMTDAMVLLLRAGKEVPIEPAIFRELAATGAWNGDRENELFRRHDFAFLVTVGKPGDRLFDDRYAPATEAAMLAAYRPRERVVGYWVWTPISDASDPLKPGSR